MKQIYTLVTFLVLSLVSIAQNAADYYTANSNAFLQDMTGAQILLEEGTDDAVTAPTALPFAFNFGGTSYTQFSVSSNGLLGFGANSVSYGWYNNDYVDRTILHSDTYPIVMPWGDDLTLQGGDVSYKTEGNAGSQIMVIQWKGNTISDGVSAANKTFQVWLYEGTNVINFVYGRGVSSEYYNASVGIASSASNYKSVNTTTDQFSSAEFYNNQTWPGAGKSYVFSPTAIPQFVPLAFSSETTFGNVSCFGENNGSINLGTVTGGNGEYNYSFTGPNGFEAATATINGLAPGTYTYAVTDGVASEPLTGSVTISEPGAIVLNASASDVSCFGASNGSIQASADNAEIVITNNGADVTAANGSYGAGTYVVTATNNGCSVSQTVEIVEPAELVLQATATDVTCSGAGNGSIQATANNATIVITRNGTDVTASNGSYDAGTYTVTATNNGCSVSQDVQIAEPAPLVLHATATNVSCFGAKNGSIQTSANNATIVITKDGSDVTALNGSYGPGTYVVTATNNGCSTSTTIQITQPPVVTVSATATDVSCNASANGKITVVVSQGATYTITNAQGMNVTTAAGFAPGVYTVAAKGAGDCSASTSVTVKKATGITMGDIKINPVYTSPKGANANTIYIGYGTQQVTLSAGAINGGSNSYAYSWSPSLGLNKTNVASVIAKPGSTTTYTLTVTDNVTKCTTTETFTVNVVDVRTGNNKILLCHNSNMISVSESAVSSHLNHGDNLGSCSGTPQLVSSFINNIIEVLSDNVSVYPNPTGGQFNVTIKEMGSKATINIINSNGKSVAQMSVQLNGKTQSFGFNLSSQPAGLYFVTVVSDHGVQIDKVVIQ